MMEALFFPWLNPDPALCRRMRVFFQDLFFLFPFSGPGPEVEGLHLLRPAGLDEKTLRTLTADLEARIGLLGKEAFCDFFSEGEGEAASPSVLASEILGKKVEKAMETEAGRHLRAAFFLLEGERLDRMHGEISGDLHRADMARKKMLALLKGEEEGEEVISACWQPSHVEARVRAWIRLLAICPPCPRLWVTDMSGVADILENLFPGAVEECAVWEDPENPFPDRVLPGRLFRIFPAGNHGGAHIQFRGDGAPPFFRILCLRPSVSEESELEIWS